MELKERLRELRNERNMSAPVLAEKLGKAESTVRMWEIGKAKPDIDTLIEMSKIFNCTTDYLLGLENNAKRENVNIGLKYCLSDKAIKSLEEMARTYDRLTCISLGDVLNSILEYSEIKNLLYLIESHVLMDNIKKEKIMSVINSTDEKTEPLFDIEDAVKIHLNLLITRFAKMVNSIKENGIKSYHKIDKLPGGGFTIKMREETD